MATMNFNAGDVAPQNNYDPIPPNKYLCMITDSKIAPNAKNTGTLLTLTWEVIEEGPYKGSMIFDNLNVQHQNAKAQEISQRQLSAICHATGVMNVSDSVQLHNIPVIVKVDIERSEGYSPKNITKGYEAYGGTAETLEERTAPKVQAPAHRPAPAATTPAAASKPAGSAPPWKK